jgi:hypothetical protein
MEMRVSVFELSTIYATAFKMFGMALGTAKDAASIAAATDIWGQDGLDCVLKFLDRGLSKPAETNIVIESTDGRLSLNTTGCSLLTAGSAVLDLACTETHGQPVVVSNLLDTELAPGLACLARARSVDAFIEWRTLNETNALSVLDAIELVHTCVDPKEPQLAESQIRLHLGSLARKARDANDGFRNGDTILLDRLEVNTIRDGARVDAQGWAKIVDLANTMLVPENEQSRAGGAGVGADGD